VNDRGKTEEEEAGKRQGLAILAFLVSSHQNNKHPKVMFLADEDPSSVLGRSVFFTKQEEKKVWGKDE
jgi:hypothetical protein